MHKNPREFPSIKFYEILVFSIGFVCLSIPITKKKHQIWAIFEQKEGVYLSLAIFHKQYCTLMNAKCNNTEDHIQKARKLSSGVIKCNPIRGRLDEKTKMMVKVRASF